MSYYFVAQIKVNNEEEYQKYLKNCNEVFCKYKGKYLAVDDSPMVLEGSWQYSKVVIIEFPDKNTFSQWYESPEYQVILEYRLKAAKCDTVFVKGID